MPATLGSCAGFRGQPSPSPLAAGRPLQTKTCTMPGGKRRCHLQGRMGARLGGKLCCILPKRSLFVNYSSFKNEMLVAGGAHALSSDLNLSAFQMNYLRFCNADSADVIGRRKTSGVLCWYFRTDFSGLASHGMVSVAKMCYCLRAGQHRPVPGPAPLWPLVAPWVPESWRGGLPSGQCLCMSATPSVGLNFVIWWIKGFRAGLRCWEGDAMAEGQGRCTHVQGVQAMPLHRAPQGPVLSAKSPCR